MFVHELETPVTIVDLDVLERNIASMAALCRAGGVALRPMIKTHKSPFIARRQMEHGAVGVLVATLDEAEEMARAGIADITVAYPLVNPEQRKRLRRLAERVKLTVSVDSVAAVQAFSAVFGPAAQAGRPPVDVLIIIDSGGRRLGVTPDVAVEIARAIVAAPGLRLAGVATHPGHVYGCSSPAEVEAVAAQETGAVLAAAEKLRAAGFAVSTVAVGSTPTARFSSKTPGITEIRPGNYVFYDAIQVALGSATLDDCALRVLGTVLSRPTPRTAVVDVGSKMLSSDKGAHGLELVRGYGVVVGHPDVVVERVSEELAVLSLPPESPLQVGDRIEIVPNHACTACNLVDALVGVRDGVVETVIPVTARRRIRLPEPADAAAGATPEHGA
nr:amino-acid racemase [Bacillota bacterium]